MKRKPGSIRHYLLKDISGKEQPLKLTIIYSLPFILVFIVLLGLIVTWEIRKHEKERTEQLMDTARAFYDQVLVEKQWLDRSDGSLVRRGGEPVNFAVMLREMSAIANRSGVYKLKVMGMGLPGGHHNADEWARETLGASRTARGEAFTFIDVDGITYFRYFRPLPISGAPDPGIGLAIDVPTLVVDGIHRDKVTRDIISYGTVGGVSLLFVVLLIWKFSKKISAVINREIDENRLKAAMELAGAAAHEMRQPLQVITGYADIIGMRTRNGEDVSEPVTVIKEQCRRTDEILQKMLNITHYGTIDYANGLKIFDLHSQGGKENFN